MSGHEAGPPREPLDALDRELASVRFSPRESLGPEIWGAPPPAEERAAFRFSSRPLAIVAIAFLLLAGAYLSWRTVRHGVWLSTIDTCCQDLDGGGAADDGILVTARGGEFVRRLTIYEDLDRSGGYSGADQVRFARGEAPTLALNGEAGLNVSRFCCQDYDGGGRADDGLLIVGAAPGRIALAAIYEGDGHAPPVLR
jgi:hypothetical protein